MDTGMTMMARTTMARTTSREMTLPRMALPRMAAKLLAVAGMAALAMLGSPTDGAAQQQQQQRRQQQQQPQRTALSSVGKPGAGSPGRYATVNGLRMYYEIHGKAAAAGQPPLVLIHGALSGIESSFGKLLPGFAKGRQVIAVELQGHAHTADADRPFRMGTMAQDTVALLDQIGVKQADVLGYSMGSGVAFEMALQRPALVRKLVLVSFSYKASGLHPGLLDAIAQLKPEMLAGSPFEQEYLRTAPNPKAWPTVLEKVKEMDGNITEWTDDQLRGVKQPVLLVIGDSDIVRPEHAVETFRLLGGGIMGDTPAGLPNSQLAVVPGASHISVVHKTDALMAVIPAFLDAKGK